MLCFLLNSWNAKEAQKQKWFQFIHYYITASNKHHNRLTTVYCTGRIWKSNNNIFHLGYFAVNFRIEIESLLFHRLSSNWRMMMSLKWCQKVKLQIYKNKKWSVTINNNRSCALSGCFSFLHRLQLLNIK